MAKAKRRRRGRGPAWTVFVLVILVAATAHYLKVTNINVNPKKHKPHPTHALRVEITDTTPKADKQWKIFVKSAKANCAKQSGVSVPYDAIYHYGDNTFGVMVVAWKDSDFEVDLYRFDPKATGWSLSPAKAGYDMNVVDVVATSRKWSVPTKVIKLWTSKADQYMHKENSKQR